MTSEPREEVVENGVDGEGKQRKEKKSKIKKEKERKGVPLVGREVKGGVMTKKTDTLEDSLSQRNKDAEQSSKAQASTIAPTLTRLKKQVENERSKYVKATMDANNQKLQVQVAQFLQFAEERGKLSGVEDGAEAKDLLTVRIQKAHCRVSGLDSNAVEKDGATIQEDCSSSFLSLLSGSSPGGKSVVCPVKLPVVLKHPPYTTWIFLDRNQRMAEDQSVLGRRRIYYDQNGSEALICSDSEEEQVDDEDEKHEFSKGEDYIIWWTIQEHGLGETVLDTLGNLMEAKPCEIEARYEALQNEDITIQGIFSCETPGSSSRKDDFKDESKLQETVSFRSNPEEENDFDDKDLAAAMDSFDNLFCRRCLVFDCRLHGCSQTVVIPSEKQPAWSDPEGANTPCGPNCRLLKFCEGKSDNAIGSGKSAKTEENSKWSKLEKGLYEKGLEIFGKNSCLVARNMLKGMKTCLEVAEYLSQHEAAAQGRAGENHKSHLTGSGKAAECDDAVDVEVRTRTRFWRRRGRVRRLKYTWKSAGHPAIRKRIADVKDQPCKQYVPCGCQFSCGKQCSCLRGGTCCEKYCGCSKSCKNRFRGCHCAKSQCRSRQCPCFAAGRECDPDVCRNCWVGCGDGTLGYPPQRGDDYQCGNMKLLLRQQQRVLLGRSDVAGWGAFLKNSVSRHDYLGEYTGELISHREADKRGKIYDRENSSFLFNLNDQYVLDAYRKGDKLKFANHSPNPNCYAKVIMVAGDHRVGIFAKDRIAAGEELFYDYRYEPDRAPDWARKPEGSNSKREEPCATGRRAQKVA